MDGDWWVGGWVGMGGLGGGVLRFNDIRWDQNCAETEESASV